MSDDKPKNWSLKEKLSFITYSIIIIKKDYENFDLSNIRYSLSFFLL